MIAPRIDAGWYAMPSAKWPATAGDAEKIVFCIIICPARGSKTTSMLMWICDCLRASSSARVHGSFSSSKRMTAQFAAAGDLISGLRRINCRIARSTTYRIPHNRC